MLYSGACGTSVTTHLNNYIATRRTRLKNGRDGFFVGYVYRRFLMEQLNLFSIRVLLPPPTFPEGSPAFVVVVAYDGSGVAFPVPLEGVWVYQLQDWLASYEAQEDERASKQS